MKTLIHRRFARPAAALALLSLAAAAPSCQGEAQPGPKPPTNGECPASLNTQPAGDLFVPPADPATPVSARFSVTLDPQHPALAGAQREPQSAPLTLVSETGTLRAWGGVKRFAKHPERLYVELYFINDDKAGIRDLTASVSGESGVAAFYDFASGPFSPPVADQAEKKVRMGGIGPEGVGRVAFGLDAAADLGPITFKLDLSGVTTTRASASSSPIQMTSDGKEVWVVQPDTGHVAVIDTAKDTRAALIEVGGKPESVALTPDGKLALVACSACNQLTVIDRARREVIQRFSEEDGIGRDPRHVVISPDGARAYVSAYVGDSVIAFERVGDAFRLKGNVPVGRRPVGMSVTPDGQTLLVAHFMPKGEIRDNMGFVSIVATDTLSRVGEADLRDDGNVKEAACLQKIPGFDAWSAEGLSFEGTPTSLAGVFLDPGASVGWVPGLRVGGFPILEGQVKNIGFDFLNLGANSPAGFFPLDTRDPRKAAPNRLMSLMDVTDRDEAFLACVPFMEEVESVTGFPVEGDPTKIQSPGTILPSSSIPLSETGVSRFVGFSRGGRRVLMLSYVADEIMVMDAATRHPTARHNFLLSGSNPTGIAVTPDGKKGYVSYDNSLFVSVLDLSGYAGEGPSLPGPSMVPYRFNKGATPGQGASILTFQFLERDVSLVPDLPAISEIGQVVIADEDPMDPVLRRGKVLFSSSSPVKHPTLSGNREASCTACHPNGGNDGTVWGTMEGERRTMGLWGGLAGKGWLHASATHKDGSEFARIIVTQRLGGTGLSEEDVHALSEYLARGIPAVQRPRVNAALADKGKVIFAARCANCHRGETYGSGDADPGNAYGGGGESGPGLYDVGSATDWANATLGEPFTNLFPPAAKDALSRLRGDRDLGAGDPVQATLMFEARPDRKRGQLKAPSLINTWENVLFFHDGRASSLEEAVKDISARTGEELSGDDLAAVVEYLKTL